MSNNQFSNEDFLANSSEWEETQAMSDCFAAELSAEEAKAQGEMEFPYSYEDWE